MTRTRGPIGLAFSVLVAWSGAACRPFPAADEPRSEQVSVVATDARTYDPAKPPVPLTSIEAGGGRVQLAGLWRAGPFVRLALSAEASSPEFSLRGRFGPLFREMGGLLLVDPARGVVHPVLTPPGVTGVTSCLCSPSLLTARRRATYYADFHVPESVAEVVVLGDSVPSFGRVRIASVAPDLAGAGYQWVGGEPPPLGSRAFDDARAGSPLAGVHWPDEDDPAAVTLSSDLLFGLGSAELTEDARQRVAAVAAQLRELPASTTATVVGHTDSRGGAAANRRLSQRRAEEVAAELEAHLEGTGVQLAAEGRGEDEPLPDEAEPARHRRVEVLVPVAAAGPSAATRPAAPADALPSPAAPGEVSAVEVAPDTTADDLVHVGVERAVLDPDMTLLRVDLRLALAESTPRVRRSLLGDEALSERSARFGNGARDLRLIDTDRHVTVSPVTDSLDHCLCPDEIGQTLVRGASERLSVWFPAPPPGTGSVNLLVPRAGLVRSIPIR